MLGHDVWMDPLVCRARRVLLATVAMLGLLAAGAAGAQATGGSGSGNGTIKVIKGGDRVAGVTSNRSYAAPVSGATFEYTSSAANAKDPASTGWLAFPSATGADGTATVGVSAGTYFVRERTTPAGFANFGAVRSLSFDPSSSVPSSSQPYVAKVVVSANRTTEAYPNRLPGSDTDDWSATSDGDAGSPFVNVRDNQAFPAVCGINVLLVLDRSGSIRGHESSYRDAAKTFVNSLAGTPTQIGILSFSAGFDGVSSYQDGSGDASLTHAPTGLSAAGVSTLNSTIDRVYTGPSGATNWDAALQKASQAAGFMANGATGQTASPDVVVLITDGNPTARSTEGSDSSDVDLIDLTAGMASANLVKSRSARAATKLKLYALGVGSGVTAENLKAVSGPVLGEDYETPTVAQLTAKLTELAARTCGARVFVRKRLAGSTSDRADWGFTATSTAGTVSYLDGNRRTHATAPGTVETAVLVTQLPEGSRSVTLTEDAGGQPLSEFTLDGAVCRTGGYDGTAVPTTTAGLGATVSVQRGSALYCTFTNSEKRPQLTVSKTPDAQVIDAGQDAEFTIVVGNAGAGVAKGVTVSDQLPAPGVGGWTVSQQPSQGSCAVNGANLLSCSGLGDLATGQSRTVKVRTGTSNAACATYENPAATATATNAAGASDGGTITCRKRGSVTVTKTEAGSGELDHVWTFALSGGPEQVELTRSTAGGNPIRFGDLAAGDYTLCETGMPAGWKSSLGPVAEGRACTTLMLAAGEAESFAVDNTRPAVRLVKGGNTLVHHGDTITYTLDVSNAGNTPLKDVTVRDPRCDAAPVRAAAHDGDAVLEGDEVWRFTCASLVGSAHDSEEEAPIVNVATAHAFDRAGNEVTDSDDHATTIIHPDIAVDKQVRRLGIGDFVDAGLQARVGETLEYRFTVTGGGSDTPIADVQLTDARCDAGTLQGLARSGGDGDALLEAGEAWTYTCTHVITGLDLNPLPNTATATGRDPIGGEVRDADTTIVALIEPSTPHPAVDIEKTGPATAAVGTALGYTLTVTNPGDVPFAAQDVVVTDPRCDAPPAGPGTGADQTPGALDPGDTWTYTCTAQTTGQPAGRFVNTARVEARDSNGRSVSDSDDFATLLEVQQEVLTVGIVSGTARLRGPSGCVRSAFTATITGTRIARVTFFRDGRRIKRITAEPGQETFRVTISPSARRGVHRVTARVEFVAASRTLTRSLRLSYQRCRRQVAPPRFTG